MKMLETTKFKNDKVLPAGLARSPREGARGHRSPRAPGHLVNGGTGVVPGYCSCLLPSRLYFCHITIKKKGFEANRSKWINWLLLSCQKPPEIRAIATQTSNP